NQGLWKVLCYALHEISIVCAGRHNPYVIGVLVSNESVHRRQAIEILRAAPLQFNFGAEVDFIALPPFDSNRTGRSAYDCHTAAISKAENLVTRRHALQRWRGRLVRCFLFLSRDRCSE